MRNDAPDFSIPAEFWQTLTEAQFFVIARTGHLEGELLKKYWKFSKHTGPMPEKIQIFIRREDVQRLADQMELARQTKQ